MSKIYLKSHWNLFIDCSGAVDSLVIHPLEFGLMLRVISCCLWILSTQAENVDFYALFTMRPSNTVEVSVQGNSSFYVKLFALYYCYEHDCFYIYLICVGRIILQMKNRKKVEQNQEGKSVLVYAITANRSTAKRVRYVENNFQWHL